MIMKKLNCLSGNYEREFRYIKIGKAIVILFAISCLLLLTSCSDDKPNNCAEITNFYQSQINQVLKQTNPDLRQLKNLQEERDLKLKQSGCK